VKFFTLMKDGGPESHVWGYWLVEIKGLCSIVLLRFEDGTREAYHSHAFNAVSWLLRGTLHESVLDWSPTPGIIYRPSWCPIWTPRSRTHKVRSIGRSWVLSFRGPWADTWLEYDPKLERTTTLAHGRNVVGAA